MRARRRAAVEPWPLALAAALCFMIGTSLGFWRVARAHPDALVVEDAEGAARGVDEALLAARRAEALGWEIELQATPRPGATDVRVSVRDAAGRPLALERVTLRRERPAEGGLDAEVALGAGAGAWSGEMALPRPGRWHLRVRAERGADVAERSFALWAP
jgi:nitrogen fixation protein FixH